MLLDRFRKDKGKITSKEAIASTQKHVHELHAAQKVLLNKLQTKRKYEVDSSACPPLDFTKEDSIEYTDGVFIKDLTTDEQAKLDMNVFHVLINEDAESPLHRHLERNQIVFIKKGKVINLTAEIEYSEGDIFCIEKKKKHSLKYLKDSEVIFLSIPGYNILKN